MSSRDAILARVKAGVGKGDFAARRQAAEARLVARPRGPQPTLQADLAARFKAKAEALASTVEHVSSVAEIPAAAKRYLEAKSIAAQAVVSPDMAGIDWAATDIAISARGAVDTDAVGITGCFCGVAETGTIMLLSSPDTPATVSLLPETHIAVVLANRIVATMEDAFALLRAERGAPPRAINFISGPSRTGDIEQTLVLGAHGPCRVHLLVVG